MRKLLLIFALLFSCVSRAYGDQSINEEILSNPLWKKFVANVKTSFFKEVDAAKLDEACLRIASEDIKKLRIDATIEQCIINVLKEIDTGSKYITPADFNNLSNTTKTELSNSSVLISKNGTLNVRIHQFTEADINALASKLITEVRLTKPEKIVIDLRGNSGGLLTSLIHIGSFFIPSGETILLTNGRSNESRIRLVSSDEYGTSRQLMKQVREDLAPAKIYVLIDKKTASGAEALALLLKSKRGATLIGEKSFGNADLYTILPIGIDSALKLKTAEMVIPGQPSWSGSGLTPDVDSQASGLLPLLPSDVTF